VPPVPPTAATGQTIRIDAPGSDPRSSLEAQQREGGDAAAVAPPAQAAQPSSTPDQQRDAILRMIAEGRITPEEGDLLLESLGS
jgi:hypothetical protein